MSISKQQVLDNLETVKKYIQEAEEEGKTYTKEELIELLKTNVQKFNEIVDEKWEKLPKRGGLLDLTEADLSEANLYKANLSGANLTGANLTEADLSEADLYGADLTEADLYGANLTKANLSGANLYGANLTKANLSGADLWKSTFYGKGARLILKKNQVEDFLLALGFTIED